MIYNIALEPQRLRTFNIKFNVLEQEKDKPTTQEQDIAGMADALKSALN